jgi:hypothetical protein
MIDSETVRLKMRSVADTISKGISLATEARTAVRKVNEASVLERQREVDATLLLLGRAAQAMADAVRQLQESGVISTPETRQLERGLAYRDRLLKLERRDYIASAMFPTGRMRNSM